MGKSNLIKSRTATVINGTSKWQEQELAKSLVAVEEKLKKKFPTLKLCHFHRLYLDKVVAHLRHAFPGESFYCETDASFITPDGGFLCLVNKDGTQFPILISEVKNQGTNDIRKSKGLSKQAMGNAIERLGKNVIALRTYLMTEDIFPFVCFGYGCDFKKGSSILDRVTAIAMFGKLNKTYLKNQGCFNRGSFYFRQEKWGIPDMTKIMYKIAHDSIRYYLQKYGEESFTNIPK